MSILAALQRRRRRVLHAPRPALRPPPLTRRLPQRLPAARSQRHAVAFAHHLDSRRPPRRPRRRLHRPNHPRHPSRHRRAGRSPSERLPQLSRRPRDLEARRRPHLRPHAPIDERQRPRHPRNLRLHPPQESPRPDRKLPIRLVAHDWRPIRHRVKSRQQPRPRKRPVWPHGQPGVF